MRPEKEAMARFVGQLVGDSAYLYLITYKGLAVHQFNELRDRLHSEGAGCHVLKNTFLRQGLASQELALPADFELLGDTALVFGNGDPAGPAKVLKDFGRQHGEVGLKGGVMEGRLLSADEARAIAELPPKEQLYAEIVGAIKSPATSIVRSLQSAAGGRLVRLLLSYANTEQE